MGVRQITPDVFHNRWGDDPLPFNPNPISSSPIGVFDSGIGGLTVLKALKAKLPHEDFLYLGDTARLPYGTKSERTVAQYSRRVASLLLQYNIKFLVIACNTATSFGLPVLQKTLSHLPVCGVIDPCAAAAVKTSKTDHIAVIATEGTIRSESYRKSILRLNPEICVQGLPAQLLVSVAEEGWINGSETEAILTRYLMALSSKNDVLVLGCTHFPVFTPILKRLCPDELSIVDSGSPTADLVADMLAEAELLNPQTENGSMSFLVTDLPERFEKVAPIFMDKPIDAADIDLVDIPMVVDF
ncbi:MAG: glutamate racemase [Alphaproteobacteria bacterium]|nr:glutamate racemase [Alphaproteobacteria bacterium]MCL2505841.1 glutamate racemase [Alphaproteobacteria bacterium]